MNIWLENHLVCPRDHGRLVQKKSALLCSKGHEYPYIDGIPIMLISEAGPTHPACRNTLLECLSESIREEQSAFQSMDEEVDSYVQRAIVETCGLMYTTLRGKVRRYPIPEISLPTSNGQYLLDVGCNWGRWSISASRKGYIPVGIDPSLEAIRSARRVALKLGSQAFFVVADARHLPFSDHVFDVVFSYSVLQHFERADVRLALRAASRVLKPSGTCLVQMPTLFGLRNIYNQCRRRFRKPRGFEVRYWSVPELRSTFDALIGSSSIAVDGFFSLNPQASDIDLLPSRFRLVVRLSDFLRKRSSTQKWLKYLADSVYVESIHRACR